MLNTYLKSGWRNLVKNKVHSTINIAGLSLGLTCSVLTGLWVMDEFNIDSFHENSDRLYIVTSKEISGGEVTYGGYDTPGLLGEELPKVLPEFEYAANYAWAGWRTLTVGETAIKLPGGFAGKDFLKIFSYTLLNGSKQTALDRPESILLSRKLATTLFGSPEQAIDKSLKYDNYKELKVTGVFEDIGTTSSNEFEFLVTWDFFVEQNEWVKDWGNSGPSTFALLKENVNIETVLPKIQHFIKAYDKDYTDNNKLELGLQLYRDKYLHSNFKNGVQSGGRIEYVRLFQAVAIFILMIACINFMNMSTARSVTRAKEIGVRKVIGAMRSILVTQFMVEAFLSTIIAVVIAIVMTSLLLPEFNMLAQKNIASPLGQSQFWISIGALTVITATLAGIYPALFLSSFKPMAAIRNTFKLDSSSVFFRKGLVVFQFSLAIVFVVGMIVISKQVDYIFNKNIGYQKSNLIYLPMQGTLSSNFRGFKNELLQIPGVENVTAMGNRPIELENTTGGVDWEGKSPDERPIFTQMAIGYDFVKTMDATLLAGRDFSEDFADSANYLINEAALKIIGYKEPVGMPLALWGIKGTIVGVVKDFHFESLHVPVDPLIIRLYRQRGGYAAVRIAPGKMTEVIDRVEALHKKLNPDFPFGNQYADEEYASMYNSEQVVQRLSKYFALLSIVISCLGLLGLVIFAAAQRTKEVGIRKVLGASVPQIVTLLSGDFMKLVVLAMVFSFPAAWYLMSEWLKAFEYRIDIQWWMFAVAGAGAVLIALFTLIFHAVKAALANPVNSLKSE